MAFISYAEKHYKSAYSRTFESVLDRFIEEYVPQVGGPELRNLFAQKLIELFDKYLLTKDRIQPGQMLWLAVDKDTRADSTKVRYIPTVLTLVDKNDIDNLLKGESAGKPSKLLPQTIARLCKEAYQQGALLSMRDLALIFKRADASISSIRKKYEEASNEILPTPSTLQDMGSGVTHKGIILHKVLVEKKDMAQVRFETQHSQKAIDNYLKDYHRAAMLFNDNKSIEYISKVTKMSSFLLKQYEKIYKEVKRE
ncbi:MAG: DUF1670 domain-containing protein [Desulfobacteraceae bacterium]|nr:DUF1670 domain-containing protein [Desulfobacteraceae bacterium]